MSSHEPDPAPDKSAETSATGYVKLGVPLTLLLMIAYFAFIGLGAFAPTVLAYTQTRSRVGRA